MGAKIRRVLSNFFSSVYFLLAAFVNDLILICASGAHIWRKLLSEISLAELDYKLAVSSTQGLV